MVCVQKTVARTWRKEVLNLSSKGLYEKLANKHFILEYIKIMDSRNRVWRSKYFYFSTIILLSLIRIEMTRLCSRNMYVTFKNCIMWR